jgi:CNT family concentrative nucleoside transporter
MDRVQSLFGFSVFLLIAYALSENRGAVRLRTVAGAALLQTTFALLFVHVPFLSDAIFSLNRAVGVLQAAAEEGSMFIFGYLGGGAAAWQDLDPGATYIFAFRVLPLVIVVSALSSLLFHWGVLPFLIRQFARLLQRALSLSGPVGFGAGASVFMGTIETPLLVRPYLASMQRGELFAIMTCVMATVAGTVMVAFAALVEPVVPGALGHILVASVTSVPAALVVAHLMIPVAAQDSTELPAVHSEADGNLDALMRGTSDGTRIALDIAGTIIVLLALVHVLNAVIGLIPLEQPATVQGLAGQLMRPLVWLMGIPWSETAVAGEYMGVKTVMNEFVAYIQLGASGGEGLSERSRLILMYALCGFANLGSVGIVVGGLNSVLPERRREVAELCLKALVAGTLATMMTGALIGALG